LKISKNMQKKEVSVFIVIPTYNEKENIPNLTKKIFKVLNKKGINGTLLIVDDDSPDGTGKIADSLSKIYNVRVLHRKEKRGYGNSILAGFKKALDMRADVILTMDSDFSHNPLIIPKMLDEMPEYDVVIGSRRVFGGKIVGWSRWRHFCSSGASYFSKLMLGLKTKDITSGFRAYKREVLENLILKNISSNGYSFLEEILYYIEKKGFKIKEVPIVFLDRKYGKSKLSKKEILKFFFTIIKLRFSKYDQKNN